jgi:cytochrome c551/c552
MDIAKIAGTAIALLGPYLAEAGKALAKEASEQLADKVGALYQKIKNKFKGDAYAEQTLARVEEKPDSAGRQDALRTILTEKMEEDEVFAKAIRRLVEESEQIRDGDVINQQLNISDEAKVEGDVFQIGKMEGGITKRGDS